MDATATETMTSTRPKSISRPPSLLSTSRLRNKKSTSDEDLESQSPNSPGRFSAFRKSAVEKTTTFKMEAVEDDLFRVDDDIACEKAKEQDEEWWEDFELNLHEQQDDAGSEDEPESPSVTMIKSLASNGSSRGQFIRKLSRRVFRISRDRFRTESDAEETKTQSEDEGTSPRMRELSGSFSSSASASPMIKKKSFWSSGEPSSPLFNSSKRVAKPTASASSRDLTMYEDIARLEECIRSSTLKPQLIDSLLSAKEDLLLKVQFISTVHEYERMDRVEEEVRQMKASKIVKRYLGKDSTFKMKGIPAFYEEKLIQEQDYSAIEALKMLVLEQLVHEEAILRGVHDCFSTPRMSSRDETALNADC